MLTCAQNFASFLSSKNLNFTPYNGNNNDVIIDFPYKGKTFKCIFSGDEGKYLTLYLFYETVSEEKVADVIFLCNELNMKYKWVTFFLDNDKTVVFHDDAILSPETAGSEAFELLVRMINIGDEVKPAIMKAIYA